MRRLRWMCLALMAAMLFTGVQAEEAMMAFAGTAAVALPAGTLAVEDEAFMNDKALDSVALPDGLERIGARAFADSGVKSVLIPATVSEIADDAFKGCAEALVVWGFEGSKAQEYCLGANITFKAIDVGEGLPTDWADYDALIKAVKSETNNGKREALMHEAEDMLMATGAIVPLYYYNDVYLQSAAATGVIASLFGFKDFRYADVKNSDTLRAGLAGEPETLDPALNSAVDGACLAIAAFGGLYAYGADGVPTPDFATGYKVSGDGLTYTFTMRKGLKWSDGTALTARDFEYSWKRAAARSTEADYGYMFDVIRGYPDDLDVSASSDGATLTVHLNAPCAYMLDLMAFPAFFAVPRASVEKSPKAWAGKAGFVCSGPFTLTAWSHNKSMTYTRNPNYWNAGKVKLEKLTFTLAGDEDDWYKDFKAGKLDFVDAVPLSLTANPPDELHIIDSLGTYYAGFNVKSALFDGKTPAQAAAMRRAIGLLIDRTHIVESIGQSGQLPANSFIPAGMADGHNGVFKRNDGAYTYPVTAGYRGVKLPGYHGVKPDVNGAIALLKQAGFAFEKGKLAASTPLSFEYLTNEGQGHVAIANAIRKDLAAVGIDMTVRTMSWPDFLHARAEGRFDLARNGWLADFNDPVNMLEMWTTDSGNNDCQFGR